MLENFFPTGIASGAAFLGRDTETQYLTNNVENCRHTLLLSPRRYGKTSLVKHVMKKIKLPSQEIDLFLAADSRAIERKILKGTQALIEKISERPEQWFKDLIHYFRKANKKWSVGIKGFGLEIEPENHTDIPDNINEALNAVEMVLMKKKQKAILFIDEFQEIAHVDCNKAIEGAIRHFAQESKHLILIFSGSDRHILKHMFDDQSRPLYELCERIDLQRLPPEVYHKYLNKIAKKTWGKPLPEQVFKKIIALTECHPRIVYMICGRLWDHQKTKDREPNVNDVEQVWNIYLKSKLKDIRKELLNLSNGQIKVLTLIAISSVKEPSGQLAQRILGMSGSAIIQAIRVLEQKDYVEKIDNGSYKLILPTIKGVLIQYNKDSLSCDNSELF